MTRRAGVRDTVRVVGGVITPTIAGGVIRRRPHMLAWLDRLQLDHTAVRVCEDLRARYGPGAGLAARPRTLHRAAARPGRRRSRADLHPFTVLTRGPGEASGAEPLRATGALVTPASERAPRRRYNERVLESDRPVHCLAGRVRGIVGEETRLLLTTTTELDWRHHARTWWRIVRRLVLGDHTRDDAGITDELAALRMRANWAFLLPKAGRRRDAFRRRLDEHLSRAEPGSLAAVIAEREPEDDTVDPFGQVPQWLFAFDAAGMVVLRALALLAIHPKRATVAREEAAVDDPGAWPYLRACVLDTVRLWPTTPLVLRESTAATSWRGTRLPPATLFLAFAPYFHRAAELVPFADTLAPEASLERKGAGSSRTDPVQRGTGPLSRRASSCSWPAPCWRSSCGQGSTDCSRRGRFRSHDHARDRLPTTVNSFGIRLAYTPYETRGSSA